MKEANCHSSIKCLCALTISYSPLFQGLANAMTRELRNIEENTKTVIQVAWKYCYQHLRQSESWTYTCLFRFSPVCGCKQPRVLSHTSLSYCMRGKTHLKQINWKVLSYFIINPSVSVVNFWSTSWWENWPLSQKIQFNISNVVCKLTASGTSQEGNIVPVIIDIHFGNLFIKGKVCFL